MLFLTGKTHTLEMRVQSGPNNLDKFPSSIYNLKPESYLEISLDDSGEAAEPHSVDFRDFCSPLLSPLPTILPYKVFRVRDNHIAEQKGDSPHFLYIYKPQVNSPK